MSGPPRIHPQHDRTRLGAAELQQLVDAAPLHRELEMKVQPAGEGRVVIEAVAGAAHLNAEGSAVVHGGIVATLLDAAATFVLIALDGDDWSTVDLRIDYLRPVPAGPLRVAGEVVHAGRRVGRASAALSCVPSGQDCARATGTFVRAPTRGPASQSQEVADQ